MKLVNIKSIEKAIEKIDVLDEVSLEEITNHLAEQQTILLAYALSASVEYNNEELNGLLIYYFCLINEAFAQEGIKLRKVEESDLDELEDSFTEILDTIFEMNNLDGLSDIVDQVDLVQFMLSEISTPDDDGTSLSDDTATQLFIVTLAMIILLNNAIID